MKNENKEIYSYRHIYLRDLAWILLSPSLMQIKSGKTIWTNDTWGREQYQQSKKLFEELDKEPGPLETAVRPWPHFLLGKYFESLWSFWLTHNPRYEIRHENLQLFEQNTTLGEFDFIVQDLEYDTTCHWEVAVKFYLGHGNTSLDSSWYGLQFRDRLDKKIKRFTQHQCLLSERPQAKELFKKQKISIDEVRVIMKGRLFYPQTIQHAPQGSNPSQLSSTWLMISDFFEQQKHNGYRWVPLDKSKWMSPQDGNDESFELGQLKQDFDNKLISLPICLAALEEGIEVFRIFVVADGYAVPEEYRL